MGRAEAPKTGEVAPGMKGAWLGILAYRWVALTWMVAQALIVWSRFRSPHIAAIALLVTVTWNAGFTLTRACERPLERGIDLGLAFVLLATSGFVMDEGTAGHGSPFFATAYPAAAALTVGAGSGVGAGLGAGAALSVALLLSRLANHIALRDLTPDDWINLVNGSIYFLAAGGAAGGARGPRKGDPRLGPAGPRLGRQAWSRACFESHRPAGGSGLGRARCRAGARASRAPRRGAGGASTRSGRPPNGVACSRVRDRRRLGHGERGRHVLDARTRGRGPERSRPPGARQRSPSRSDDHRHRVRRGARR